MATRKELIDQVRADQRERSALTRADNPKPAIVSIGDRDPLTGQYQVLLPDGSVEMGEKQFNSSLPNGSQVLGIPQSTGGWLLDERDVQPIKPPLQPSTGGKIKVLYSQIEGNERVFYLWGDRAQPKRIGSIPYLTQGNQQVSDLEWTINNRGSGDRFIVNILWKNAATGQEYIDIFGDHKWSYTLPIEQNADTRYFYLGQGFWSIVIYRPFGCPNTANEQSSYSLYKGVKTNYSAIASATCRSDVPNLFETRTSNIDVAISPDLTRHNYTFGTGSSYYDGVATDTYFSPFVLDQNSASCIYKKIVDTRLIGGTFLSQIYLANASGEIILEGDSLPFFGNRSHTSYGSLIKNKFYQVFAPLASLADREWNVDVYKLGANTTKSTIKAKVTYKPKAGMFFHHASYHP